MSRWHALIDALRSAREPHINKKADKIEFSLLVKKDDEHRE